MSLPSLHALVLAGGGGTRLWPLSRRSLPKQFLRAFTGTPLLADTVSRLHPVIPGARVWVVAGGSHEAGVREALPSMPAGHFVREPSARNTAPAIALGVSAIALEDPDAVVAVLPSDHVIGKPDRFRAVLAAAGQLAVEREMLVTLGIVPDRPATGYGYIERGESLGQVLGCESFGVRRFVEKPDSAHAVELLKTGHLWNAGVFVWRAKDLLDEVARLLPDLGSGLAEWRAAAPDARERIAERVFARTASISVDYAVLEKSTRVAVVPASDVDWDDIGSFRSLARVNPDANGGASTAKDVVTIDATGNLVHAPGKTVALVGVQDLVIVDTPDALLIIPRDRAEEVKAVVEELKKRKRDDVL